jgi:hypothetical protein
MRETKFRTLLGPLRKNGSLSAWSNGFPIKNLAATHFQERKKLMPKAPHLKTVYIDATLGPTGGGAGDRPQGHIANSTEPCPLCGTRKEGDRIKYDLWLNPLNYDTKWVCLNCSDKIEGARNRDERPMGAFYE